MNRNSRSHHCVRARGVDGEFFIHFARPKDAFNTRTLHRCAFIVCNIVRAYPVCNIRDNRLFLLHVLKPTGRIPDAGPRGQCRAPANTHSNGRTWPFGTWAKKKNQLFVLFQRIVARHSRNPENIIYYTRTPEDRNSRRAMGLPPSWMTAVIQRRRNNNNNTYTVTYFALYIILFIVIRRVICAPIHREVCSVPVCGVGRII